MSHLTLVYSAPAPSTLQPRHGPQEQRFTGKDLIALTCWTQRSDAHGYRRVLIEAGGDAGAPEDGGYVLIYGPGQDWASWGLARTDAGITVWHCGTGSDRGRHPTMLEALDSLPPAAKQKRARSRTRVEAAAADGRSPVVRLA